MKKKITSLLLAAVLLIAAVPTTVFAANTAPKGKVMFDAVFQSNMRDLANNNYYGQTGTWLDCGNGNYAFVMTKFDKSGKFYPTSGSCQIGGYWYTFANNYTKTNPDDHKNEQPVGPGTVVPGPITYGEHWEGAPGCWMFVKANGKYAKNEFVTWKGSKYYLRDDGVMVTGKHWISGDYYLFYTETNTEHSEGEMVKNGWLRDYGCWYYASANGKVVTGKSISYNGNGYYLHQDGKMATGLTKVGSNIYYYNNFDVIGLPEGAMVKSRLLIVNGYYYYFGEDGAAVINGNVTINGYVCHFDKYGHWVN